MAAPAGFAATLSSRYTRTLPAALPLASAEETVLAFVRQYSANVRLTGTGVLSKLRGAETRESHLLVRIDDETAFNAAFAGPLPFAIGYSEGNTFTFTLEGVEFTLENLTPEAFTLRLTEIVTVKKIAMAQDGLSYDPATRQLSDPFGAEKSALLKIVNTTVAGGAAIGLAIRGKLESQRLGMRNTSLFTNWQNRNLRLSSSVRTAQSVMEAFLSKLATAAEDTTPDVVKSLLKTKAISTALTRIFGLKAAEVIADFDRLRPAVSGEFSNTALWLVVLLGPEIESDPADGAARTWLERGTRFDAGRSRKALLEAQKLAALPMFQPN